MNKERVLDITMNEKGNMYAMAEKRELYVSFLHKYEHKSPMNKGDQKNSLMDQNKDGTIIHFSIKYKKL